MENRYYLEIVINKEKLSNNKPVFVAHCTSLGIASQGMSSDEAIKNIKAAINLYLEEFPEKLDELELSSEIPTFSLVEVKKNTKTSSIVI